MMMQSLTFKAGGTLKEGHFYVERPADQELPSALLRGEFCYVLAPRQMGKSSLRYRVALRLSEQGMLCASVDLTALGGASSTVDQWYFGLLDEVTKQIGGEKLRTKAEEFWVDREKLAPVQRFIRCLREVLLVQAKGRIVIFVDEVDAVRALRFPTDDFFAAIRAVYNTRPNDPEYERLIFCLLGVAQPGDLIRNQQITPFNIGTRIDLADFERQQLAPLARGLRPMGGDPDKLLDAVYDWTHGHPYMTQRLCLALVPIESEPPRIDPGREASFVAKLVDRMFRRRSEARDANLAYAERGFQRGESDPRIPKMLALYNSLIRGERVPADGRDEIQGALQLAGMAAVRLTESGIVLQVRNRIFSTVFDAVWVRARQAERMLAEPVSRWLESGRKNDFVLRGEALRRADQWSEGRDDITSDEHQFLSACWRVARREDAERMNSVSEDAKADGVAKDLEPTQGRRRRLADVQAQLNLALSDIGRLQYEREDLATVRENAQAEANRLREQVASAQRQAAAAQAEIQRLTTASNERSSAKTLSPRSKAQWAHRLLTPILFIQTAILVYGYVQYRQATNAERSAYAYGQAEHAIAAALARARRGECADPERGSNRAAVSGKDQGAAANP